MDTQHQSVKNLIYLKEKGIESMEKSVQDFIGLTLIQADILAEQRDYNTRVVKVDSVSVPLSEGTRNNRVNFEVETPLKLRKIITRVGGAL